MLIWEYGFLGAYIELDETIVVPEPVSLIIKFSMTVLKNLKLTKSEFYSLNERLTSSEFVSEVWTQGEQVFYKMPMAENIVRDVIKIMDSKFTEVGDFYKKACNTRTHVKVLPSWPDNVGHFIMQHNLPLAVMLRHNTFKDMIMEELDVKVPPADLFRKFSLLFDVYSP